MHNYLLKAGLFCLLRVRGIWPFARHVAVAFAQEDETEDEPEAARATADDTEAPSEDEDSKVWNKTGVCYIEQWKKIGDIIWIRPSHVSTMFWLQTSVTPSTITTVCIFHTL